MAQYLGCCQYQPPTPGDRLAARRLTDLLAWCGDLVGCAPKPTLAAGPAPGGINIDR